MAYALDFPFPGRIPLAVVQIPARSTLLGPAARQQGRPIKGGSGSNSPLREEELACWRRSCCRHGKQFLFRVGEIDAAIEAAS